MFKVEAVTTWAQVEEAATVAKRCIQPEGGSNWARAKQSWEENNDFVAYYTVRDNAWPSVLVGYVRLHRVTPLVRVNNATWVVDYFWPIVPEVLVLVADLINGHLFVKPCLTGHPTTRHWPKVTLSLQVPTLPYQIQREHWSDWQLVMK